MGKLRTTESYCLLSKLCFRSGKCYAPFIPLDKADLVAKSVNAKIESPSGTISSGRGGFDIKPSIVCDKYNNSQQMQLEKIGKDTLYCLLENVIFS